MPSDGWLRVWFDSWSIRTCQALKDKVLAISRVASQLGVMELDTLRDLYKRELAELYCFEKAQHEHLPKVIAAVRDSSLKEAFERHLQATRSHEDDLKGLSASDEVSCGASEELVKECVRLASDADAEPEVRDAAMLAAVQQLEHLEIAKYGAARSHAEDLGDFEAADVLAKILEEEGAFDRELTRLAERSINFKAADN